MKDNKQTYTRLKDYTHEMSYENESTISNDGRGNHDLEKIIDQLKKQLNDAKIIDNVDQKLNGTLQKKVTELEIDNKRLVLEIDDLKERLCKCE